MRQTLQAELGNVHIVLEQKEASLAQQETNLRESKERLHTQLSNLQNQLAERQQLLEAKMENCAPCSREIAVLEERIIQLESLHNEVQATAASEVEAHAQESQSEREAWQASLREKEEAVQQHQAVIARLEANLDGNVKTSEIK